jgi:hypothetical protein
MQCNVPERVAVVEKQVAKAGVANAHRVLQHRLEHRLRVAERVADDGEDLGGRRLLLQRFGQFARARLHLVEEADVLDRYHGLIRECRQQFDLLVRERLHGPAQQIDHADGYSFTQQRHSESQQLRARRPSRPLPEYRDGMPILEIPQVNCNPRRGGTAHRQT